MNRHIVLLCCLILAPQKECWYDAALGPVMSIAAFVLAHWGLLYLPLCVAVPPLFVKLQMNYFLPIHHHPIWGGRRAKCGSELGSYGDAKQKDIDLSATTFHLSALTVMVLCLWSVCWQIYQHSIFETLHIIRIQFSGFKELMQHNNKFKSNAAPHCLLCFLWKKFFGCTDLEWGQLLWMCLQMSACEKFS